MLKLYTWSTPNGRKISIALEEMGLSYTVSPVDIAKGEQFGEVFLAVSPNNKIPALTDEETGISLFESGAILQYLAEKTGKFLPSAPQERWAALQWLSWQISGFGPMLGQTNHFLNVTPGKAPYAEERFSKESLRLYDVLEHQLSRTPYLAGAYSIADMATWPWVCGIANLKIDLARFPNIKRWYLAIAQRPAVQKGYRIPKSDVEIPMPFGV